jgi:hypothetical protein
MEPEFITYQKFDDIVLAEELTDLLEENGIAHEVEEQQFQFDPSFVLSNAKIEYAVKIKSEDFERVTQLTQANEAENIEGVEPDYYLFGFTDEELMEVIAKADEWSAFDVVLARKILGDRGKAISDKDIATLSEKRIEVLEAPDPSQTAWIVIGYICALLGGLLGIFIGWYLTTFKKTLPNGERVYEYSERDRKHGRRIFYIGIIVLVLSIAYKIMPVFEEGY